MGFEQLNYKTEKNEELYEEVSFLLKKEDPKYNDSIVLRYATKLQDYKTIKLLIEDGRVNVRDKDNYCIKVTALNNNPLIMKFLLEKTEANPTASDNYPLYISIEKHNKEVFDILIEDKRINLSIDDNYPLYLAIITGNIYAIDKILERTKFDINKLPEKVILKAIENKKLDSVKHIMHLKSVKNKEKQQNDKKLKLNDIKLETQEVNQSNIYDKKIEAKEESPKEQLLSDITILQPKQNIFSKAYNKLLDTF